MGNLARRLEKLERQRALIASDGPTEAEWHEALALSRRYYKLWGTPRWLCEISDREITPTLAGLSEEDRAFVRECEAGALARAEEIDRRYREAHGIGTGQATAEWPQAELDRANS